MTPKLFETLPGYRRATFLRDLGAGITVAMVALPLSLAIAIASGAPPEAGLVTAIVAGFLISAFGGSTVQIGGPTGAFIVVVYGVIAEHGYDGLVTATFMAGAILLIAGLLKAGALVRHIPEPVIDGFTIGIAAIIALSQLRDLFGLRMDSVPADTLEKIPALWAARDTVHGPAVLLGLAALVAVPALRRAAPRLPGLMVAVAGLSALALLLGGGVETIGSRFGALPRGLPLPGLPELGLSRMIELLPSALTIAFLAGVESLLSAMVADRMVGTRHRPNAEVIAQGIANLGSALFAGLPATGAIARTATNVRAGGQTPVAGIIHALVIALVMLVAAPLAGHLAMPVLAAVLLLTAWNMAEVHKWPRFVHLRRSDQVLLGLTFALTVLADLTVAIGTGVALSLALRLRRREVPPAQWDTPER